MTFEGGKHETLVSSIINESDERSLKMILNQPSCPKSLIFHVQTVDLDFPNTTECYRLYCQRFIASDIKECVYGVPDTPYDGWCSFFHISDTLKALRENVSFRKVELDSLRGQATVLAVLASVSPKLPLGYPARQEKEFYVATRRTSQFLK
ncbi:unnamed protein product [Lactuca saligna]|uniref:Uncharacterized protein n=1 Tax=Lactuca saligna TaxID=75948 RepID=A0AA35Z823_LACSI|nr:unnamed protein product [Lactuca saligna]